MASTLKRVRSSENDADGQLVPYSKSKRQKTDPNDTTTPTNSRTVRALKAVFGGVFGRANDDTTEPKRGEEATRNPAAAQDIYDVPNSTSPDEVRSLQNGPTKPTPTKRGRGRPRKIPQTNLESQSSGTLDLGDNETPISSGHSIRQSNDSPSTRIALDGTNHAQLGAIPAKRKVGRPRKSMEPISTTPIMTSAESPPVKRKRGRPRKSIEPPIEPTASEMVDKITPITDARRTAAKSNIAEAEILATTETISEVALNITPSRKPTGRPRGRPRKSVTFDDTPASTTRPVQPKKRGRPPKSPRPILPDDESDESTSEEDEIKCVICGSGDSEEPNEIVLCDNCEIAVHQECYYIPELPDDDWLCRDCAPVVESNPIDSLLDEVTGPMSEVEMLQRTAPAIEGFDHHLKAAKTMILERILGKRKVNLRGLDNEYQKVHQLVMQTAVAGEGNSMLVIGARGSGKTTLVDTVLSDVSQLHRDKFHVIRLNGFVHTDDKLALRDIWRQLGREMEVDDDVTGKTTNYADTLASLLALLSHPSDFSDGQSIPNEISKSVIFIIDEFDLFAAHPRQTLLYNLFDIAQSRKAPIAVLGLTTRVNVAESLEKRVKSRFSHRYVHLSLPRSLASYWEICREGLILDSESLNGSKFTSNIAGQAEFLNYWNKSVDDIYAENSDFTHAVKSHYYKTKSVSDFFATCVLPITSLSNSQPHLANALFAPTKFQRFDSPDSKLHIISQLSLLELALLIAAARLDVILDVDTCTFAMAYDEYISLTTRHRVQTSSAGLGSVSTLALGGGAKVWGRDVALGAWEHLVEYGLLLPAALGSQGTVGRDAARLGGMWRVDVALVEIPGSAATGDGGLPKIMEKWCKEI